MWFGNKTEVSIHLEGETNRPKTTIKDNDGKQQEIPIFETEDDIVGKVQIQLVKGKKLEHKGIKVELLGRIETHGEKTQVTDFFSLSQDLEPAGVITTNTSFPFSFCKVQKQYESYYGNSVRCRYVVKATVFKQYSGNIVKEYDFAVQKQSQAQETNSSIKMEVGIEDCLHIEFEYDKQRYHLKDVIIGKVYFLLVRIKIKHMELCIVKRETIGAGQQAASENETVVKFEVMDGAPVRGENIPIRLYLSGYDLTPSFININNRFSVKFFLNLVLIDEEDRRYFKQQEIILWRNTLG